MTFSSAINSLDYKTIAKLPMWQGYFYKRAHEMSESGSESMDSGFDPTKELFGFDLILVDKNGSENTFIMDGWDSNDSLTLGLPYLTVELMKAFLSNEWIVVDKYAVYVQTSNPSRQY